MKKINWKSIVVLAIAVLVAIGIVSINVYKQKDEKKNDKPVVKIGVTLPLTGSMAKLGKDTQRALQIRLSEIPEESKYQYKLIFEDDQLQSSKEFANAQKLINFNNVDVMISGFSGGASAIADLADKAQVVYWNFQWTDEIVKKSPYVFSFILVPKDVAKAWLDVAYQRGVRKIAIINNEAHAGGEYVIAAIKELLPNYPDMEIVGIEHIPLFGSDLRTTLLKMNAKKPDIYLATLLNPTLDEFGKKMKEQNITTPISSINRFEHSRNKELFEGNWAVGEEDYNEKLFAIYKERYKEDFDASLGAFVYDAFDMMIQAYEQSDHKLSGKELANRLLEQETFNSGFGVAKMDENGLLHAPVVVGEMHDEKFVPVEK
ncbi:MAG: ABC transporter substrate-binding protein [Alphaproteobacteria bacterium]|nr:ABC transporter substrate-binding protein [Alphaproteobacteria bacterium]